MGDTVVGLCCTQPDQQEGKRSLENWKRPYIAGLGPCRFQQTQHLLERQHKQSSKFPLMIMRHSLNLTYKQRGSAKGGKSQGPDSAPVTQNMTRQEMFIQSSSAMSICPYLREDKQIT